jgi:hypothetical protein
VAAQLAASQEGLSSMILFIFFYTEVRQTSSSSHKDNELNKNVSTEGAKLFKSETFLNLETREPELLQPSSKQNTWPYNMPLLTFPNFDFNLHGDKLT